MLASPPEACGDEIQRMCPMLAAAVMGAISLLFVLSSSIACRLPARRATRACRRHEEGLPSILRNEFESGFYDLFSADCGRLHINGGEL